MGGGSRPGRGGSFHLAHGKPQDVRSLPLVAGFGTRLLSAVIVKRLVHKAGLKDQSF